MGAARWINHPFNLKTAVDRCLSRCDTLQDRLLVSGPGPRWRSQGFAYLVAWLCRGQPRLHTSSTNEWATHSKACLGSFPGSLVTVEAGSQRQTRSGAGTGGVVNSGMPRRTNEPNGKLCEAAQKSVQNPATVGPGTR
jgi:hypothetical protein